VSSLKVWENHKFLNEQVDIQSHYISNSCKTLYVLSRGFDPRMCEGIVKLREFIPDMDVMLIKNEEGHHSSSEQYGNLVQDNLQTLRNLECKIDEVEIKNNSSNLTLLKDVFDISKLSVTYSRIIIDVSSMPQSIFVNLINHVIRENSKYGSCVKLDVIICENSQIDDAIIPTGLSDSAKLIIGLDAYSSDLESDENPIPVLIPLLGKGCQDELEKLYTSLSPVEVCPVLPFPSKDPRRSDDILSILGKSLFESFSVDVSNIVYVAEQNIFDVYMKLCNTIMHYNKVLKTIGDPRFYISIGSSKLIGLGALLANIELRSQGIITTFVTVDNCGYRFDATRYNASKNRIFCLCINEGMYGW